MSRTPSLNTVDRYDLSDTPLGLLLGEDVDLKTNKAVTGIAEQDGAILVRARTSPNRNDSNIQLVFSAPQLELRQWIVKDNQGGMTTVALQNLQAGASLPDGVFLVPAKNLPLKEMTPVVGIICDRRSHDGMAVHQVNDEYVAAIQGRGGSAAIVDPGPPTRRSTRNRFWPGWTGCCSPGRRRMCRQTIMVGPRRAISRCWMKARDATSLPLLRPPLRRERRCSAICRGFQELNVALGGSCISMCMRSPAASITGKTKPQRWTCNMARRIRCGLPRAVCWPACRCP